MSEWQPAVIFNAHKELEAHPHVVPLMGKKVRVRDVTFDEPESLKWIQEDCDTTRAFRVHPQDFERLTGRFGSYIACEHEILTD
jgi:hypothetical protein